MHDISQTDHSAGDGVKYSLPQADSNTEGSVVVETNQSLEELMNQMKTL